MRPKAICTIGYEGGTVAGFIRALKDAGVEMVLDIRAAPVSRKKGFSKNQLAAHLAEAGSAIGTCAGSAHLGAGAMRHAPGTRKSSSASSKSIWRSQRPCSTSARRSRSRKLSRSASCVLSATLSTATV